MRKNGITILLLAAMLLLAGEISAKTAKLPRKQLLNDKLPLTIGGGIGQSRLCMVLLHKAHLGEIQASIWPDAMRQECEKMGMNLI